MNKRRLIYLTDAILIPLFCLIIILRYTTTHHRPRNRTRHLAQLGGIPYHRQSALYYIRDHTHQESLVLVQRLEKQKNGNAKHEGNKISSYCSHSSLYGSLLPVYGLLCFVEGANLPFGKLHYKWPVY